MSQLLSRPGKRFCKAIALCPAGAQRQTPNQAVAASTNHQIIFSGIQPTQKPHLGNYLGALREWAKLQNSAPRETSLFYSIVNLHAFTVQRDANERRKWQREMLATLLAVGLDPERATIFYQSHVPEHLTMMWILGCGASIGPLERMTQWKSKAASAAGAIGEGADWGLFSYPILQAADILLYRTTHVPVGYDQTQHLEYARHLAASFNHRYGEILVRPTTILSPTKRIMSLTEPHLKMSKSHADPSSRINITDASEEVERKIRSALTDSIAGVSYDPVRRPGVSNLVEILAHMGRGGEERTCQQVAEEGQNLSMRAFKELVAESINAHLAPIREEFHRLLNVDQGRLLDDIARRGAAAASKHARATMDLVREATGFELPV